MIGELAIGTNSRSETVAPPAGLLPPAAVSSLQHSVRIDDKPSTDAADVKTAKNFVRQALDQSLAGKPVSVASSQPYGCSVKY